ncbi:MAG: fibronectin type III domain-containing protein, partial [Patescibacteria group bacterium]|nr:fibronectin type III domain-containing protein [Patescibacteria group bacterium]
YICSPTGFTVSGTGPTTLSLSWNAVTGAATYTVATYPGGQLIYSGSGTGITIPSGLTCNTSYSYSLNASNAQGTSANVIASGSTYVCPPATPTGLSATAASQTQANLTWTDNATNETGYYVYRGGVLVATLGVNSTSYNDTSLSCGTSYSYYVVAYNAGGTSAASNTASATTVVCTPATPTGLSATPLTGCSQISLSWTDNATNETGYYVYRGGALAATLAANSTSYTDGGLTGATSYSYFVRAYNAGGNADSNTASASTNSCVSSPGSPSSGMTVGTVISTDLGRPMTSLSWSGSANGFIVVRYNTTDGYHLVIDTSGASAIDQTNIRCPATYTYYIYGYNTDTSLGTTDSSCTSQSPLTSAGASLTNKKCSAPVAVVRNMDYCTKGFFNN